MIQLSSDPMRLPIQVASRVLPAPGVWAPDGLSLAGLGALVTAPLGWEWDGQPMPLQARAGSLLWAPPRRPLKRYLRRLQRERSELPRIFTLAPDAPSELARAAQWLEPEAPAALLLWDAAPNAVAAVRQAAPTLPLLAEFPCTEAAQSSALLQAGADGLWLGPPRAAWHPDQNTPGNTPRLWGPAILPLLLAALEHEAIANAGIPRIAGAGVASAADAHRAHAAGAALVALDPAWWVQPNLAGELSAALEEE